MEKLRFLMTYKVVAGTIAAALVMPALLYYPTFDNEVDVVYRPAFDVSVSQLSRPSGFFTDEVMRRFIDTYSTIDETLKIDPHARNYRPLAMLYFGVEYSIFGDNRLVHGLINFASYSIETVLFFFLMSTLTRHLTISCVATVLFSLDYTRKFTALELASNNPILYLLAVLCFVRSRLAEPSQRRRVLLLISFFCALYAQFVYEVFTSLPLVITLIELIQGQLERRWKPHYPSLALYYLPPVIYIAATSVVYHGAPILAFSARQYSTVVSNFFLFWTFILRMFVPVDVVTMRRAIRQQLFGGLTSQEIFAMYSTVLYILMVVAAGLLAYVIYRVGKVERVRRFFLFHRTGQSLLLGSGWMVLATLPALLVQPGDQRLMVSVIGACLVKAAVIDWLSTGLTTETFGRAKSVFLMVLVIPLVVYQAALLFPRVREVEYAVEIRHGLVHEIEAATSRAPRDTPLHIYVLNFTEAIGAGQLVGSDMTATYFLRQVLGRDDVFVKTPYSFQHSTMEQYQQSVYPYVDVLDPRTFVVHNPDPAQPIGSLNLQIQGAPTFYVRGQTFRREKFYDIELQEINERTSLPTKFLVRLLAPPGVHVLVFLNEKGRYRLLQPTRP